MKNKNLKCFSVLVCLLVAAALLLSSCADADIIVSREKKTQAKSTSEQAEIQGFALTVNISTGTFHLSEVCRYAAKIKEENKKIILYSDVQTAIEDGYEPCSVCAEEYKN